MATRKQPENEEMKTFFAYCKTFEHLHPCWKLAFHVPNEGKFPIQYRVKLKSLGVKSGVPDIIIPVACGKYHGLAIEMKVKPNKPSEIQKEWLKHLTFYGWLAKVCYGWQEATDLVANYIKGKV